MYGPVIVMVRESASEAGGRGFDPEPVQMVPVATLLGAQHYKVSTGKCLLCW